MKYTPSQRTTNEDVKKLMLKMVDDSYKAGFSNACGVILECLEYVSKRGVETITISELQSVIAKSLKLNNEKTNDWSKYGL